MSATSSMKPEGKASASDYSNGQPATRFTADGAGIVYYPSPPGKKPRVAVVVSVANSYQKRFMAYDKPKSSGEKSLFSSPKTLLCAIDEHVVGFAMDNGGKGVGMPGARKLLLTKAGACTVNKEGVVTKQWLWDAAKQGAGTPPKEPIAFQLNDNLRFQFVDRAGITLTFQAETVRLVLDMGEKLRRTDTYMEKAVRHSDVALRGKMIIDPGQPTLLERQKEFNKSMFHKSKFLKPESSRMDHPDLASMMAGLEKYFAPYEEKIAKGDYTPVYNAAGWKEDALHQTIREVPQHRAVLSGTVKLDKTMSATMGATTNFSDTKGTLGGTMNFGGTMKTTMRSTGGGMGKLSGTFGTMKRLEHSGYLGREGAGYHKGKWLDEFQTKRQIRKLHPPLERSSQLNSASGFYTRELPADATEASFRPLEFVKAHELDDFVASARPDQLVTIVCLREDLSVSRTAHQLLQSVNGTLSKLYPGDDQFRDILDDTEAVSSGPCPYRIGRVNMSESPTIAKRYNIHTSPFYLMFHNRNLVYAGVMGGTSLIKLNKCNRTVNYLLIEPNPRQQMKHETVLRADKSEWALVGGGRDPATGRITGVAAEASRHIRARASMGSSASGETLGEKPAPGSDATAQVPKDFSIVLVSSSVEIAEMGKISTTLKRVGAGGASGGKAVAGAARLCGGSLVVAIHPSGTVFHGADMCGECRSHINHKVKNKKRSLGSTSGSRGGGGGGEAGFEAAPKAAGKQWTCPHCCVVQNPRPELLMSGNASMAVVEPIKAGTLESLKRTWQRLKSEASLIAQGRQPIGVLEGPAGEGGAGVHLGLTHDDVLKRMASALEKGRAGQYLPKDHRASIALSSSETVVRGVPLNGVGAARMRKK